MVQLLYLFVIYTIKMKMANMNIFVINNIKTHKWSLQEVDENISKISIPMQSIIISYNNHFGY